MRVKFSRRFCVCFGLINDFALFAVFENIFTLKKLMKILQLFSRLMKTYELIINEKLVEFLTKFLLTPIFLFITNITY